MKSDSTPHFPVPSRSCLHQELGLLRAWICFVEAPHHHSYHRIHLQKQHQLLQRHVPKITTCSCLRTLAHLFCLQFAAQARDLDHSKSNKSKQDTVILEWFVIFKSARHGLHLSIFLISGQAYFALNTGAIPAWEMDVPPSDSMKATDDRRTPGALKSIPAF